MKIVCISDTHNQHRRLIIPDGDMLIHAGDLSILGTVNELNDSLSWLGELPHKYKIVVAGNHDFAFERKSFGIIIPSGVIYLENSLVEIEGLKIWGSPICPIYYKWAFMRMLHEREKIYSMIPDNADIIINHSPPIGILDFANRGCHAGCQALAGALRRVKPRLCVSGHIHEDAGTKQVDATLYVNAAVLNKAYQVINQPIIVEL